jgi:hypothetical protein
MNIDRERASFDPGFHGPRMARSTVIAGLIVAALSCPACSPENHPTAPAIGVGVYGVVESENHVPAAGAMVWLRSQINSVSPFTQNDIYLFQLTDGGGRFSFGSMPSARYELLAGYVRATSNQTMPCDSLVAMASVPVVDPAAPTGPMRLTLRPPGEFVGRLRDGVPAVYTYMYAAGSGGEISYATIDPRGEFRLAGLPQGAWRIMGYQNNPATDTEVLVLSLTVAVHLPGETIRLEDIPLALP